MKKISIIIPCYNAEKYISRCMVSLVNQTIGIQNIEIILVNDASTDNTLNILIEWEQKYPETILIINCEKNGRQGTARNIGITYATSEYIGFVDIDDIVEVSMYDKLFKKAQEYDCDIVICRSKKHNIEQLPTINMGKSGSLDYFLLIEEEGARETFIKLDINVAVWNKIYRRNIIEDNNITFPEGFIYEDICFSELIKHYACRIYLLEEFLYHHILRSDSISNRTSNWQQKLDWFFVEQIKIQELKNRGIYSKYKEWYENDFFINYITLIKNFIKTFGYMQPNILNDINIQIIELYPHYLEIPLIKNILKSKDRKFLKLVCEGLSQEITDEFVQELVNVL